MMIMQERLHAIMNNFAQTQEIQHAQCIKNFQYSPLTGGLSAARNFKFEFQNTFYVLRLFAPSADLEAKKRQISIAQSAASIGVGPKIHFVDSHCDALVMDYIDGSPVKPQDFNDEASIAKIAHCLKTLHNAQVEFPIAVSPFERFHVFLKRATDNALQLLPEFERIAATLQEIEKLFARLMIPLMPCHLDLHPLNIMHSNNTLLLIDWANGGKSNPYFDLATFALFHGLNEKQEEQFLWHYFDRNARQIEKDLLNIAKPIRLLVIAAAYLSMQTVNKKSESCPSLAQFIQMQIDGTMNLSYEDIGFIMFNEGISLIDSEEFKTACLRLHVTLL